MAKKQAEPIDFAPSPKTKVAATKEKVEKAAPKKKTTNGLTDEQVIDRAKDWVHYYRDPNTRDKMDGIVAGLKPADARAVILCGQRISGGLKPKVIR